MHRTLCGFSCLSELEDNVKVVASNRDRPVTRTDKVGCCVHGTSRSFIPGILHIHHFSVVYRLSHKNVDVLVEGRPLD